MCRGLQWKKNKMCWGGGSGKSAPPHEDQKWNSPEEENVNPVYYIILVKWQHDLMLNVNLSHKCLMKLTWKLSNEETMELHPAYSEGGE